MTEIYGTKGLVLDSITFLCSDGSVISKFGTGSAGTPYDTGVFASGFNSLSVFYRDIYSTNISRVFNIEVCDTQSNNCFLIPDSCDGASCVTTSISFFDCSEGSKLVGFAATYISITYYYNNDPNPHEVQQIRALKGICGEFYPPTQSPTALDTSSSTNNLDSATCAEGYYITELYGKKGLLLETMSFKCNDGTIFGQFGTGSTGTAFDSGVFSQGFSQFTVLYRDPFLNGASRVFNFIACDDAVISPLCYTAPDSCDGPGCATTTQELYTCVGTKLIGFSVKYVPFRYDTYNSQPGPYVVQYMARLVPICGNAKTDVPKLYIL